MGSNRKADEENKKWLANKEIYQAAYLFVEENLEPEEIARRFNKDKSTISRWLSKARGIDFHETIFESETRLHLLPDAGVIAEIRESLYASDLQAVLEEFASKNQRWNDGRHLDSIYVVTKGREVHTDDEFDDELLAFGVAASALTLQWLQHHKCIAVGWGRTMRALVDAVLRRADTALSRCNARVFPLWGEAWGPEIPEERGNVFRHRWELSASTLARDLARAFDQSQLDEQVTLESIPTSLPILKKGSDRFTAKEIECLQRYFLSVSQWKKIFGRTSFQSNEPPVESALISKADLMLVPFGAKDLPGRFLHPEYLKHVLDKEDRENLLDVVCGDIGGVLLETNPESTSGKKTVLEKLKKAWTGVRADDLKRCVARAANKRGGVIGYGTGPGRPKAMLEAVRHGLVSKICLTEVAAKELHDLATAELK